MDKGLSNFLLGCFMFFLGFFALLELIDIYNLSGFAGMYTTVYGRTPQWIFSLGSISGGVYLIINHFRKK